MVAFIRLELSGHLRNTMAKMEAQPRGIVFGSQVATLGNWNDH